MHKPRHSIITLIALVCVSMVIAGCRPQPKEIKIFSYAVAQDGPFNGSLVQIGAVAACDNVAFVVVSPPNVTSALRVEQERNATQTLLFSDGTKKAIAADQAMVYLWDGSFSGEYKLKSSLTNCDSIIDAFPHLREEATASQ